jgi:hypothetical protein
MATKPVTKKQIKPKTLQQENNKNRYDNKPNNNKKFDKKDNIKNGIKYDNKNDNNKKFDHKKYDLSCYMFLRLLLSSSQICNVWSLYHIFQHFSNHFIFSFWNLPLLFSF